METILPHVLTFRTARDEEYDRIVAFVDEAFGRRPEASLVHDFPTALGRSNLQHLFVGTIDDTLVTAAAALVRTWQTSVGPLRTACLGSFFTPAAFRGRGYSAALQQWALERLADEGVDWAVLWTQQPELYRGRGFRTLGRELHGRLEDIDLGSVPGGYAVREARKDDVPALLALYRRHRWRAERDASDFALHLDPRTSRILVLENGTGVEAYAAVGKGKDFVDYVHEYAGEPALVHALWGAARERGARFVLVPDGAEAYLSGRGEAVPRRMQPAAMGRAILPDNLPRDLDTISWAAWGFDSA